jgi:hypothetical protein
MDVFLKEDPEFFDGAIPEAVPWLVTDSEVVVDWVVGLTADIAGGDGPLFVTHLRVKGAAFNFAESA